MAVSVIGSHNIWSANGPQFWELVQAAIMTIMIVRDLTQGVLKISIQESRLSLLGKDDIVLEESQSWGFISRSTAMVILGQVLSIVTCGSRTHTEVTAYHYMPN